jgi:glycosyltransferase involved in cell wall biosynthesis
VTLIPGTDQACEEAKKKPLGMVTSTPVETIIARLPPVKLIIQIPCYNEEAALPVTLDALPRKIPGIDIIEWLVIDDGSEDETSRIAREHGVHHVVTLPRHMGLAAAFQFGLNACVKAGADIIVNTDADNQYCAADIPRLIKPVLAGKADMVVGTRPISEIEHFSPLKKVLQRLGSSMIRVLSGTDVVDAPSGFRALSREAAMRMHVFNKYTYTLESIIQAGHKGMVVTSIPVSVNAPMRPSRLVRSIPDYIRRQILTMLRIYVTYKPLRFFMFLATVPLFVGAVVILNFVWLYLTAGGAGHIQSLVLASGLIVIGFTLIVLGIIADLIAVNRKLLEKIDWKVQVIEEHLLAEGQKLKRTAELESTR